jgi:hypothetical protein
VHVRTSHETQPRDAEGNPAYLLQAAGDYFEKFLFYRGVGNFDLPVTVQSRDDGSFGLVNRGAEPLQGLILAQYRDGALQFSRLADLPAGAARIEPAFTAPEAAEGTNATAMLWHAMRDVLLAQGLYEKEADAMIRTWDSAWFREEGTRLFYVVPRKLTDDLLPLKIEPTPQETVRVLIGCMEILSTAEEQRILEIVASSAAARQAYYEQQRALQAEAVAAGEVAPELLLIESPPSVPDEILRLGRFAEPALARIVAITKDPTVSSEAGWILANLQIEKQN